jgi:site-specific recombinase XerD
MPLRGFTMRTPKTLPDVPTDNEVLAVIAACPETLEGLRNRTVILALADSGLRANELLYLLVEDWRTADRGLFVRGWKGAQGSRSLHRPHNNPGAQNLAGTPPVAVA